MIKTRAVFFWLGGVLTETIPEAVARALYYQPIAKVDIRARMQLWPLVEQVALGRLSGHSFCQRMIELSVMDRRPDQLEAELRDKLPIREPVVKIIGDLPDTYQRWLIYDYPAEWYDSIAANMDLGRSFQCDRCILTSRSGLSRTIPDLYYYLARQAGESIDSCLIVDGVSSRAVEAIKHRIPSALFVDAGRLRREFVLRRMFPPPPGFVMPGPIES